MPVRITALNLYLNQIQIDVSQNIEIFVGRKRLVIRIKLTLQT